MTQTSAMAKVTFIPRLGSFSTMITASCGDLRQFCTTTGGTTTYTPDFSVVMNQPTIEFRWWNSRGGAAASQYMPVSCDWTFDGQPLTFGDGSIWEMYAGNPFKIKLKGNPIGANSTSILKATAVISTPRGDVTLEAETTVSVMEGSDNAYLVVITSGDNNNFVITSKVPTDAGYNSSLVATVCKGSTDITSSCNFKWYQFADNDWHLLSVPPGNDMEVSNLMVEGWGLFKVEAYDASNNKLGFDTQQVLDASDPMRIEVSLSKPYIDESELALDRDDPNRGTVITPKLVYGENGALVSGSHQFHFTAIDTADMPMNGGTGAGATFTVTPEMAIQCGADVRVIITSAD